MFYSVQEQEHYDFTYTTESGWDKAEAWERGESNPDVAWICTDRDVWHKNPFYVGPPVPHPEDGGWDEPDTEFETVESTRVTATGEVVVVDTGGFAWVHNHVHGSVDSAKRFADKVAARGWIEVEYWNVYYSSLAKLI